MVATVPRGFPHFLSSNWWCRWDWRGFVKKSCVINFTKIQTKVTSHLIGRSRKGTTWNIERRFLKKHNKYKRRRHRSWKKTPIDWRELPWDVLTPIRLKIVPSFFFFAVPIIIKPQFLKKKIVSGEKFGWVLGKKKKKLKKILHRDITVVGIWSLHDKH